MKTFGKVGILLLSLLIECKPLGIGGGYHNHGSFSSQVEAKNHAIADILKNYGSLPANDYYKV
ncbi:hypothetical protein [Spirosoma sp. KNUC1025]|uniref:hypothetical protein n=1 Tax=Spirosoma sp. KNUC1025 TaxID=2894082 RepID=UPI00386BC2CA|nr:hypothetical protein LN737_13395 [Spirosoma sp. KNUC1025]